MDSQTDAPNSRGQRLEPLAPARAKSLYLKSRNDELAERSIELHDKHVGSFVSFCDESGIENMNDVTARTVNEYRLEIGEDYQYSTLSIYLSTVRQFVKFCESMNAVAPNVSERIVLPDCDRNARTEALKADDARPILSYLRKFHYASRTHALMALLWHTDIRTGTARGLDVEDLDAERDRLRIRHRPETDTPLKNAKNAERYIALSEEVSDVLAAYVEEHRHSVTDEYSRNPLFTTNRGRPAKNSIRRNIYAATRPCAVGKDCPHGREPETCEAAQRTNEASKCPSTVSGHPVRCGAITRFLRQDVPQKAVSDRMNVSEKILSEHYDIRTEDEKAEQRRKFLTNL